jgi:hypothetical protein
MDRDYAATRSSHGPPESAAKLANATFSALRRLLQVDLMAFVLALIFGPGFGLWGMRCLIS